MTDNERLIRLEELYSTLHGTKAYLDHQRDTAKASFGVDISKGALDVRIDNAINLVRELIAEERGKRG